MANRVAAPRAVGRYVLFDEIAAGGMAAVHLGRMTGVAGFARTVAIKRLHPQYAKDPEFVSMFIDEARLAARIAHPNVVSTIDVVSDDGEMLLVMEYVFGASLSHLCQRTRARNEALPIGIAVAIVTGALYGLHAAHEAKSDAGELLGVVHRDVSPQNILVGVDGVARVVDFGIAKAVGRLQTTHDGQLKGKAAYMAPEQIRAAPIDRKTDIYAASVVLWEALAGKRLFSTEHPMATMNAVFEKPVPRVSEVRSSVPPALDEIVARGLSRDPGDRFPTARAMAIALETAVHQATTREVGDWVQIEAAETLSRRAQLAAQIESSSGILSAPASPGPTATAPEREVELQTGASHVSDVKPRRRGGGVLAVSAATVLLVLGAALAFYELAPRRTATPTAPAPLAASAQPSASASVPPAVAPSGPGNPSAGAAVDAAARNESPPATHARPIPRPRPVAPSCDPPYTVDPDGTRHWKSGC
jgi:serine/threonine protein kinase